MTWAFAVAAAAAGKVGVQDLKVNGLAQPTAIEGTPVFSWIVTSAQRDVLQQSYEIELRQNGSKVLKYKQESDITTGITLPWTFSPATRYDWTLRVRDNKGNLSAPATSSFLTGIGEWKARWIGADNGNTGAAFYFKNNQSLGKKVRSAYAYITAHGIYEARINGKRVGDDYFTPGWTAYNKTLQYQMYDVTGLLKQGANQILVTVAPGWWNSGMNWGDPAKRYRYGNDIALLMQVEITFTDGSTQTLCTGPGWEMSMTGPVKEATIYDGQVTDPAAAFQWQSAGELSVASVAIVPSVSEHVRVRQVRKPVKYIVTPKGEKVLDFGQNLVGWERARLRGPKGTVVTISHAEILDNDGNFYTTNLRKAKARTVCILPGGEYVSEPTFTFYGFRYIRVEGLEGDLNPDDFEAVVVDSGFDTIGSFACSDPLINQLQSNIYWGFRGNFLDIPTDCPQRDERLGWTGDAQVFFRTASYNGDVANFFRKWLRSLSDDQKPDGSVPRIIPDTFPKTSSRNHAAGWADCSTLIPWQHFQAFGDTTVIAQQYASMKAWADYCRKHAPNHLLNTEIQPFGDWLFYSTPDDRSGKSAVTSRDLIAQCFFAGSLDIVARSAALLGNKEDEAFYKKEAEAVREAFRNEYVTPNGLVSSNTQTAYVLALHFDMLKPEHRAGALDRLVKNIEEYDNHITTGFLGTPYICEELSKGGRSDVAYRLLFQKTCPSWLYPVEKGATTIWERWDSVRPDGRLVDNGMNSFNHYSYGAIGDWLYRWAGGIRETAPGYKTFVIDPHPGGGITSLETSHKSPYGLIKVKWTAIAEKVMTLEVDVPVGTKATITCPDGTLRTVGSGNYKWERPKEFWPDGTEISNWFLENSKPLAGKEATRFVITNYGAVKDSTVLQTIAIQKAIDAAAVEGGTVVIPKGVWLSGALFFKQGTHLLLEEGAVLKGTTSPEDFPDIPVHIEGILQPYVSALINADGCDGFTISGKGTLDGNGQPYWEKFWATRKANPACTNLEVRRPRMMGLSHCSNVNIEGIKLRNSAFWNIHLYKCNNVRISNLDIFAPYGPLRAPSSDGIDLDACTDVRIWRTSIATGDDLIAIKGGKGPWADTNPDNGTNARILVEDCHFGKGSGVLVFGSECIGADNVILRHSTANGTSRLLWLKMRPDTPQRYSNILVEDVNGTVRNGLYIKPWTQFADNGGRQDIPISVAENVTIRDCVLSCKTARNVTEAPDQYQLRSVEFYDYREELLDLFQREVYGQIPAPMPVYTELIESGKTVLEGQEAIREQVRMWFTPDHTGPKIDWLIIRPAKAEGPVPAILTYNYNGNHTVIPDENVIIPDCWLDNDSKYGIVDNRATEAGRGVLMNPKWRYYFPFGTLLSRGYAVVTACYGDVSSDPENPADRTPELVFDGVFKLWGPRDESRTDNTMALAAWAWGLMRGMDMIETMPSLDKDKVVVTGCSRHGKAALIAGAYDKRFAAVVPVQTGGGGVPLSKHKLEGKETIASETKTYSHWFCKAFSKYAGREEEMPFDQHLLLGCIAPRPLLVLGYNNKWFDPEGEFLSVKAASPFWEKLGKEGLPAVAYPKTGDTSAIGKNLGYARRSGKHGVVLSDWLWILDFCDNNLK